MNRIARRLGGRGTRRRRHRRFALVAVLLVGVSAILIVAGSGDDGEPEAAPTTTAATTDDPVERICLDNAAEIDTARRALLTDNTSPGAVEGFLQNAFVDLARDRSAAIRALQPPVEPDVLAVLDEFDAVVDAVEADPSIGVGANPFQAVDQRWRDVGLGGCAMAGNSVEGDG